MIQWIAYNEFLPVPVPNVLASTKNSHDQQPELERWLNYIQPNALILSGGNDVGEFNQRDITEKYLLSWAQTKKVPVLGVCRGLQLMAVWAGTSLIKLEGHAGTRHSLIASNEKDHLPLEVNSFHNWGLASCPKGFDVLATAHDGAIEAIRHNTLAWEGWMWHPEREASFNKIDNVRFRALLNLRN